MDGLGISQTTIAEFDRNVRTRWRPPQAREAAAVGTAEAEPKEMALNTKSNQLTGQDTDLVLAQLCRAPLRTSRLV